MKNMKLRGFTKRRRCVTTKRSTTNPVFADLVKRRFHAEAPNQVYVGDITYLPCKNGTNMYLATVIDLYSRKLAGFAIADHMRTSLVIEALEHANTVRGGLDGAIFHSDHGSVGGFNRWSQHQVLGPMVAAL
ncbi:MAG: DDE-type integrase/transposase/recombinase [Corynebacterium casei]|nr:DDE-type integrase/transposase/recombinase [Corynebacterium casei]MDN6407407.1 DDE-type integrase/transposase/recombinase [Corynebacterium casei]